MDWERYYLDQINKYNNNRLIKVSDFTGNQTGGFIRFFGTFLWKKNLALRKWLHPEYYERALDEYYQRLVEENEEKRKKLIERRKKITEIYGDGQESFKLYSGGFFYR